MYISKGNHSHYNVMYSALHRLFELSRCDERQPSMQDSLA